MRTDELNNRHLIGDEGKVLRRISDNWVAGNEIYLGYAYYLSGEQLAEPLLELPEHYEEIVDVEEVPDEAFDTEVEVLMEPVSNMMLQPEQEHHEPIPKQVRLTDLLVQALNEIEGLKQEIAELKSN